MIDRKTASIIKKGDVSLGIELGSTRIKAVLIDADHNVVAQGEYQWDNQLVDGIWTYRLIEIWNGISICYTSLKRAIKRDYNVEITKIK